MAKYEKLTDWLNNPQRLLMTFRDIETLIDDHLPESAHKYKAWWGKDSDSEQRQAWLVAGWEVESVDLQTEQVVFRKFSVVGQFARGSILTGKPPLCSTALACGRLPWEEPHDFQTPEPLLPAPERAVTIGIGFKCTDGLVIAADTQYTRGAFKGHGPKTFPLFTPYERPDIAVVVAGAGRVSFMKRAVQKIEQALASHSGHTLLDVQRIVEDELLDFFETYVYPAPKPETCGFELILGVWTASDGYGLFKTDDVTVNPVTAHGTAYCTIGMGFSVADYALGLTFNPGLNIENAKFVATLAVKAAKDYVDYCGGKTHLWTVKDVQPHRVHAVIPVEVADAETYSEDLFDVIRHLLHFLDSESISEDDTVGLMTDVLKESVVGFRKQQRERKERLQKLREKHALRQREKKPFQKDPQSPGSTTHEN